MKKSGALALALAAALASTLAAATPIPDGGVTAQEVAAVLQARGYQAQIGKDNDGDPKIRSGVQGVNYSIYFYGCHKTPRCVSVEFSLGWHVDGGLTLEQMNNWNRNNRFGRAYLDSEKDPWVEMDLDMEHGFTTEAISNNLDTWEAVVTNFKHYLACVQKQTKDDCPTET